MLLTFMTVPGGAWRAAPASSHSLSVSLNTYSRYWSLDRSSAVGSRSPHTYIEREVKHEEEERGAHRLGELGQVISGEVTVTVHVHESARGGGVAA